ncbi:hypothetical protein [Streptomyces sp. DSM 40484]|uniref:hypothetical protein n=1 Tax=Streptomyces kroppenstedtii TaxID=3051181 RepID=UPI0028D1FA11|nr:hypothetical protein [Streptomyces sp. DSM 40484]
MLAVIVVLTVALPLAVASAGPVGGESPASSSASSSASSISSGRASARPVGDDGRDARGRDADGRDTARRDAGGTGVGSPGGGGEVAAAERRPPASERSLTLGVGLATAARCGPELASPDGVEAQTCVLTQGRETWARTYYRNATGDALTSVLTLLAPGGRTVLMHCAVGADDEPGVCETPRERTAGDASAYAAIAEYAGSAEGAGGPLLLRSGSNSPVQKAR